MIENSSSIRDDLLLEKYKDINFIHSLLFKFEDQFKSMNMDNKSNIHKLKGASADLLFEELKNLCIKYEKNSSEETFQEISSHLEKIFQDIQKLKNTKKNHNLEVKIDYELILTKLNTIHKMIEKNKYISFEKIEELEKLLKNLIRDSKIKNLTYELNQLNFSNAKIILEEIILVITKIRLK